MELVGNKFGVNSFKTMDAADAVIFGGGGVIHSCSGGASRKNRERTGTMWNMDLDLIRALRSKIILYSVGFNKFDGEPAPLRRMGEFFETLNEKRALVSFRNDLSKQRFLEYFPQFDGIRVTPDPGVFHRGRLRENFGSYALLQIATDRMEYRYPDGFDAFLKLLAEMKAISPVPIYLISHTNADSKVYAAHLEDLPADGLLNHDVSYAGVDDAMDLYRNALFTISTRGHSQICSVGNQTPTFAMSTHPKARGFMEEVGQGEACFDYLTGGAEECLSKFRRFLERLPQIREELAAANDRFDAEIETFNRDIVRFVGGTWEPDPILTRPDASPVRAVEDLPPEAEPKPVDPALLEAALAARADEAPTRTDVAHLPGRARTVGPGSYGSRAEAPAPPPAPAPRKAEARFFRRSMRTADGASCGVVISCDANYFPAVATCVSAVRRYNPKTPITFLDAGLTIEQTRFVRSIVDDFRPIPDLDAIEVTTFPSHLSKAALSSLYADLAGYDKALYLDVDALALGDLTPMFERLDERTDVVGVRGNLFGWLSEGVRHTARREITEEGQALLQRAFPQADLDAPAINSGCFVVWSRVSRSWRRPSMQLFPFLKYFKTADQALLNVLFTVLDIRLALFDPMYNCMGFQLTKRRHVVQEVLAQATITPERCELSLGDRKAVVAHFAGRSKPWNVHIDEETSFVWDWHAAETDDDRRLVAAKHALNAIGSESGFMEAADAARRTVVDKLRFDREAAFLARRKGLLRCFHQLIKRVEEKQPDALGPKRQRVLADPKLGYLAKAVREFKDDPRLRGLGDPQIKAFRAVAAPSLSGRPTVEDAPSPLIGEHVRLREIERRRAPPALANALAQLPGDQRARTELIRQSAVAAGCDDEHAAAAAHAYCAANGPNRRQATSEAMRTATARLYALREPFLSDEVSGHVAQIGVGCGVFADALASRLGRRSIAVDNGLVQDGFARPPDASLTELASQADNEGPCAVLILVDALDRLDEPLETIEGLAGLIAPGGRLLVIDTAHRQGRWDLTEGLRLLPPVGKQIPAGRIPSTTGWRLVGSSLSRGERVLALERGDDREATAAADLSAAIRALEDKIDAIRRASSAPEAAALAERLAARIPVAAAELAGRARAVDEGGREKAENRDRSGAKTPTDQAAPPAAHIAFWRTSNVGDRVLTAETADLFTARFPNVSFTRRDVNDHVGDGAIDVLNEAPFILFGGGGLFHSTSGVNGVTQWNVVEERIRRLAGPLVMFGVGLNEFRGGGLYENPRFQRVMETLAERSVFMGFRERKSCALLRELLPAHADKIRFQPCPTAHMSIGRPFLEAAPEPSGAKKVFVNAAFDRPRMRFGRGVEAGLRVLDALVSRLLDRSYEVTVVGHCPGDMLLHSALSRRNEVGRVDLSGKGRHEATVAYAKADLVMGMRTHSQLIPFGLGKPIFSIATHDKLLWALEDLGAPAWGAELFDTEFVEKADSVAAAVLGDPVNTRLRIMGAAAELEMITQANVEYVASLVGENA